MRRHVALLLAASLVGACAPAAEPPAVDTTTETAAVDSVLTALHTLAAAGDFDRYFGLFAADAIFFGTDATERWTVDQFRGYASQSKGWTYDKTERHVFLDADGHTAWFDERLQNANYGETRGTGVLRKDETGWKIVQYNLTIPIPNALADSVVAQIRAMAPAQ